MYKTALIGCGRIASEFTDDPRIDGIYSHAEAYVACEDTILVAICDIDPVVLERCGRRWNVQSRYDEPSHLLVEQKPDIVSICTPDKTHYDLIRQAILTPGVRAVLAEKPLALTLEHAKELVQLAAERKVVLAVNYIRRYSDDLVNLREFIQSGGIGTIQTICGYYCGGTIHNGTHWFDLARFLVGDVTLVWGRNNRRERGDDPTLDVFLEFKCGATGYLQSCDAVAFSIFEMDCIGTLGRVRLTDTGHHFETYAVVNSQYYTGYKTLARVDGLKGGLQDVTLHAVEDLVECLKYDCKPRCSGEDGVAALEIALAALNSAESTEPISIGRTNARD